MTTLLTITTAVLAVFAVALGLGWWELKSRNRELKAKIKELQSDNKSLTIYHRLSSAHLSSVCEYFIKEYRNGYAACKRFKEFSNHYCVIKFFTDEDMDFALREAEELVDKLNEK